MNLSQGSDDSDFVPSSLASIVAFSLKELVGVTRQLRDTVLDLIDLAFPDSRSISRPTSDPKESRRWTALFNVSTVLHCEIILN